jgi:formylglycine-generating enzyme required for sulfatase activity/tRNA A-37 threonylcarbamoyl transferase component Bud32
MVACPSHEQLTEFLTGACSEEESGRIERHLSGCDACCQWCMDSDSDDPLLGDVRRVLSASSENREHPTPDSVETAIEGFRIEKELGRGGMGAVYLAEQTSTKRRVALKILLEGPFASETAKRRFEREVELAAHLDHGNIVTILESGVSSGRHYFAMQYVEGRELDVYVREQRLTPRETLELFLVVCRAIHYAHQRGILHRDLKPSNILVDSAGQPHVLDFGLAKLCDRERQRGRSDELLSMPGQPIGTLPYMSPEQTTGLQHDLDLRTDVYSLGIVLFRILTGGYPYEVKGDVRDVLRNIAEVAPKRPSAMIGGLDDDVDTIVLKSLSKSRARRYQSADALADDVDRYLTGRPIEAKRDSSLYVLRKLTRRHRVPLAIVLGFVTLICAVGFATYRHRAEVNRAAARDILSAVVGSPSEVTSRIAEASADVDGLMVRLIGLMATSDAYTDRVTAGRGGLLLNPTAFWDSVDGGPLWAHGEWLELCSSPELATGEVLAEIRRVASAGTDRQRYVAFCLLGQLASKDDTASQAVCSTAVRGERHPGVAMAAFWACSRLGADATLPEVSAIFDDDVSRLTFVRIPQARGFRRGSNQDDRYRYEDEDRPVEGVDIDHLYVASTEVTQSAFRGFAESIDDEGLRRVWDEQFKATTEGLSPGRRGRSAAGLISKNIAERFCSWLSARGEAADPPRRYRLPTEDEWEYAARGGSSGRFCYGDDPRYADLFANCDGFSQWHVTGERMPNWFGLSDMHGGLWEWTSSPYRRIKADAGQELFVYRGGAFYSPAVRCRSAQRNYGVADASYDYTGIRLVMELIEP